MSRETMLQPQLVVTTSDLPSTVEYVTPTEGETVSKVTPVRVWAPAGTEWIAVYACGGQSVGEDLVRNSNGQWSVQWDTQMTGCSNGSQPLDTFAFGDDVELGHASIAVEVSNPSPPPPDPQPTPCTPSSEPGPVEGQGYELRFSDCFGTLSRSVWCWNQWWEPRPPIGTQYVEDGALHLVRRRSDGYPNVTVSTEPCGQADPQSFQYGYMEARMRYDTVRGNGPAFWMLSTRHATNPRLPEHPSRLCRRSPRRALPHVGARHLRRVREHPVRRQRAPTTSSRVPYTATRVSSTVSPTSSAPFSAARVWTCLNGTRMPPSGRTRT